MHHLFYAEVETDDSPDSSCVKGFIVTGHSSSQLKAEELVRAALNDEFGYVNLCKYIGTAPHDTFIEIGELV